MLSPEYIVSVAYKIYGNKNLEMWTAKTVATNTGDTLLYNIKFSYKTEIFVQWYPGESKS